MKQLLAVFLSLPIFALGQEVASCRSAKGTAFYAQMGLVPKNQSGWTEDNVTSGIWTLTRRGSDFDVLYVDSRRKASSSKADGATVFPLRSGKNNFTMFVYYPNSTIELYTFQKDDSNSLLVNIIQSKGGESIIHKSSIMIARCDFIRFDLVD